MSTILYKNLLSKRACRLKPSAIRSLQPLLQIPGMISLGGGMPNPDLFPFKKITTDFKENYESNILQDENLNKALQYTSSYGLPDFVSKIRNILDSEHNVQARAYGICVTTGSQDALSKAFDMLIDEGDYVLCESPTYSGALSSLNILGCNLVGINTDEMGMDVNHLNSVLENWDSSKKFPKVIYTIPTGCNPSGTTLVQERRDSLYRLACKYDLLILEDDPYWFLSFSAKDCKNQQLKSLFSMDKDGRVLRFDSLSKVVSSGLRVGWIAGPSPLIDVIQLYQQATCLHACSISQQLVLDYLQRVQDDGWKKHVKYVQDFYRERRDTFLSLAEKHLTGLASWHVPSAGMFVWMKLHGIKNSESLIKEKAIEKLVLLVPGQSFLPDSSISSHVRCSFSTATNTEMDLALQRLGSLIKESG